MIALWSIPHPVPEGRAKGKVDCGVATGDDVCNYSCDLIERDVIDAKSPDDVCDVGDMFLMRFRGEEGLELPLTIMDLANVAKRFEGGDAFVHDRNLPWAVMNLLDRNGSCGTCIDDTAVVLDREELAFVIKDRPVFLNEAVDRRSERWIEMGKVQLRAEFCAVEGLITDRVEFGVDFIDRWGRVFSFAKDAPAIDVMKDGVKFMRFVRETMIVMENVLGPLATGGLRLMGNADGRCGVQRSSGRGRISGARSYCKGTVDTTGGGSYRCGNAGADSNAMNGRGERMLGDG